MRVIVDFSSAEDSRIWALSSHVRDTHFLEEVSEGSIVLLDDAEGHTATGIIRLVGDSGLMEVEVFWETWRDDAVLRAIPKSFSGWTNTQMVSSSYVAQLV